MCKLLNSLSESSPTRSPLQTTGKRMGNEEITWSLLGSTETCWIGRRSFQTTTDRLLFSSSLFSFFPVEPSVEQAVVYSTLPQEYSTLTFRGEVVAGGGGAEERSEVMYCIEGRTYIYYKRA